MAWTVAFALLGAVIFSMTIAPVLDHPAVMYSPGNGMTVYFCDENQDRVLPLDDPGVAGRGGLQRMAPGRRKDWKGVSAAPG